MFGSSLKRSRIAKWLKYHGSIPHPEAHKISIRVRIASTPKKPPEDKKDFDLIWSSKPQRSISKYLTAVLWAFIKKGLYPYRGQKLTGCSRQHLLNHLSSQFHSGMTMQNYGTLWEVDHIVPQSSYHLQIPQDRQLCFYYPNLRPSLKHHNRTKGISSPLPVFIHRSDKRVNPQKLRFPLGVGR